MKKKVLLLISLLYIDISFLIIGFGSFNIATFIRILLFNLALCILVSFINNDKTYTIASSIILSVLSVYAFFQLEFKNFMDTFYSFKAVGNGLEGVKGYIGYFISSAKPIFYIVFLSLPIYLLLNKYINIKIKKIDNKKYKKIKSFINSKYNILVKILICTNLAIASILLPFLSSDNDLVSAYKYDDNYDILLNNIGSSHFLFKDLFSSIFPKKTDFTINIEESVSSSVPAEEPKLVIDDSEWTALMEEETNTSIKNIDEYLLSKPTSHETIHTGEFEDYNFIFFLVESLDYVAIDENLTPTLYKLWNDSYHFTKHYTPMYSCATGDSEFVSMTGLYPLRSVCTPYEVLNNNLTSSLAGLFKEKGYSVRSFHNWTDQFYKRTELEPAYGMDEYHDYNDLKINTILGWQSDDDLVQKALPYFINDEKFFSFIITSSMHWPYDEDSNLGNKYIKEINEIYPDYPLEVKRYISKSMEFDKALETLISALDEAGKLDTTVISVFADHRPYKLNASSLIEYTQLVDRSGTYDENLTPFFIYNTRIKAKEIDNVCSTIDHLPTIANLFNLNYDPRLYMGNDAFVDDCTVIFNNLDWLTSKGSYSKSNKAATGNMDEDYINNTNAHVTNITNISKAIIEYDYIEKRKSIIYPKYK